MSVHWDLERELRTYAPNFDGVRIAAEDIAATLTGHGNEWFRLTADDCEKVIRVAIKHYMCRSHGLFLSQMGRPISLEAEARFAEIFRIPRYVRDLVREFCRPMELLSEVFLPDVDTNLDQNGNVLNWHGDLGDKYPRFLVACERIGLELVHVEIESPAIAPLMFYSESKDAVFSVVPPTDWRLNAFDRLRHCRHAGVEEEETDEARSDPEITNVLSSMIRGRMVGIVPFYIFNNGKPLRGYGYILGARFPTDVEHSNTPPQNRGRRI